MAIEMFEWNEEKCDCTAGAVCSVVAWNNCNQRKKLTNARPSRVSLSM